MTYVGNGLRRSGKFTTLFCCQNFSFSPFRLFLPLRRCPFFMRGLLRKFCTTGLPLLLSPFLQKGGRWWGSRDALRLLPEGLPLLPLDFCPAGGVEVPLIARSVHASSLLSPRFIRGLGIEELLSCGGLLLPDLPRLVLPPHLCPHCEVMGRESLWGLFLFSVASPASSLHALRGGEAGVFRVPLQLGFLPGFPIFGLGCREGALSLLLVGWLSWSVLLTLSLRFPCSV